MNRYLAPCLKPQSLGIDARPALAFPSSPSCPLGSPESPAAPTPGRRSSAKPLDVNTSPRSGRGEGCSFRRRMARRRVAFPAHHGTGLHTRQPAVRPSPSPAVEGLPTPAVHAGKPRTISGMPRTVRSGGGGEIIINANQRAQPFWRLARFSLSKPIILRTRVGQSRPLSLIG